MKEEIGKMPNVFLSLGFPRFFRPIGAGFNKSRRLERSPGNEMLM